MKVYTGLNNDLAKRKIAVSFFKHKNNVINLGNPLVQITCRTFLKVGSLSKMDVYHFKNNYHIYFRMSEAQLKLSSNIVKAKKNPYN